MHMALTALESILLTFAILGSVHLLVTLVKSLNRSIQITDCREMMQAISKYKFLHDCSFQLSNNKSPYYHWKIV